MVFFVEIESSQIFQTRILRKIAGPAIFFSELNNYFEILMMKSENYKIFLLKLLGCIPLTNLIKMKILFALALVR